MEVGARSEDTIRNPQLLERAMIRTLLHVLTGLAFLTTKPSGLAWRKLVTGSVHLQNSISVSRVGY